MFRKQSANPLQPEKNCKKEKNINNLKMNYMITNIHIWKVC